MNIILLGPPGAGKGTVASGLKTHLNIPHISTGDLFRFHIKNETDLGKKVKSIIDSGALVPDEITIRMLSLRLSDNDTNNGVILDGFPRTLGQAQALAEIITIRSVINLQLSREEILKRLTGRRLCRNCGSSFHINFMPPQKEGFCDTCGGDLYIRDDDKENAIIHRLNVYNEQTRPLIKFYSEQGILLNIDAEYSPKEVLDSVINAIEE